ncbi:hypothetical protein ACF059_24210 [Streptomyces sp. NPDC016562]|uniref:hypothetical protein n=1 Tax=Streptomyces sp. NPDC016562 TaxID=3364966 RepID=UPI0036F6B8FC
MSEIADTPASAAAPAVVTPAAVPTSRYAADVHTVHEAYSFACMKCGYGWEQEYAIEHHVDGKGEPFIMYKVNAERVPSPLSNPTCLNCGGHVVRIMRAGQVSSVRGMLDQLYHHPGIAPGIAGPVPATGAGHDREHERRRRRGHTGSLAAGAPGEPGALPHDAPGPVHVTAADERREGPLARLWARLRRS